MLNVENVSKIYVNNQLTMRWAPKSLSIKYNKIITFKN